MEMRVQRVVLETRTDRISGDLHLPREGYRSRLSDYLNTGDVRFVPIVNAEIEGLNGSGRSERREFVVVARDHIVLAYPEEGGA